MTTAAAAVTGISDQQLAALIEGGWRDDRTGTPGWEREMKAADGERMSQWMYPFRTYVTAWHAGEDVRWDSLDEALAWCDEQARGAKPAKPAPATKQENRFARITDSRGYGEG